MGGDELDQQFESQAEVDAVLAETGVTMGQVRRWRREGLLPDVVQNQQAYRGSLVLYPKGTCAQIRAANALFKQKNRVDYVGLRLWRLGFPVDDKYWRPRLRWMGQLLDRMLPVIRLLIARSDRDWRNETFYDRAARRLERVNDIVLSRIKRRVDVDCRPTFLRVIGDIATTEFDGFESETSGQEQAIDKATTILALDLAASDKHAILGQKLNFVELLPTGLENVSAAFRLGRFEDIADMPAEAVAIARDDARNAATAGFYLYEANRWIYGDEAFGLRLHSWIARKAPDALVDAMMIVMFRLRQVPGAIHSSEVIKNMAETAYAAFLGSKQLEWHWRHDPRFTKLLDPKRIKQAFADPIALKRWRDEVKEASLMPIETQ